MRSRQTIGDELPRSGRGTFQRTFSEAFQRAGSLVSGVTPEPFGPCQAGQFPACIPPATSKISPRQIRVVRFMKSAAYEPVLFEKSKLRPAPESLRPALVLLQVDSQTFQLSVEVASLNAEGICRARDVAATLFKLLEDVIPIECQAGFRQASRLSRILRRTILFEHDRRQMPDFQAVARSHNHHSFHQVFQLPDVARPAVVLQNL